MSRGKIGAEPGVDANSASAFMNYGHIRQVGMMTTFLNPCDFQLIVALRYF